MDLHTTQNDTLPVKRLDAHEPVGGWVIDANGREVPITEDMVQDACRELEKRLAPPKSKN